MKPPVYELVMIGVGVGFFLGFGAGWCIGLRFARVLLSDVKKVMSSPVVGHMDCPAIWTRDNRD